MWRSNVVVTSVVLTNFFPGDEVRTRASSPSLSLLTRGTSTVEDIPGRVKIVRFDSRKMLSLVLTLTMLPPTLG